MILSLFRFFCFMFCAMTMASATSYAAGGKKSSGTDVPTEVFLDYGSFITLDPLVLPIVDEDGISQMVSMVVVIEAASDRHRDTIRALTPRLKDAYIEELYGVLHKRNTFKGGLVDTKMIRDKIHKITIRVFGEDIIKDVMIQAVHQRLI